MKKAAGAFKIFSDETRLRILMLISGRELCVCQIMAVLGVSQPLVSRNLSLMQGVGLLTERRDGKLVYYCLKTQLSGPLKELVKAASAMMKDDKAVASDLESLRDCREYQARTGGCSMKAFLEFVKGRKSRPKNKRRN